MAALLLPLPPRDPNFVDREEEIARMRELLTPDRPDVSFLTLTGPPGIGKTALAVEYAHRFQRDYSAVYFIRAHQVASVAPAAVSRVIGPLKARNKWLLVLDGLDEAPEPGGALRLLGELDGSSGAALITSRTRSWRESSEQLTLGLLAPDAAMELLLRTAKQPEDPHAVLAADTTVRTLTRSPFLLTVLASLPGPSLSKNILDTLRLVAARSSESGYHEVARDELLAALELARRRWSDAHPEYLDIARQLGLVLRRLGDLRGAAAQLEHVLVRARAQADPAALASVLFELGRVYVDDGRWHDGLRLLEEALSLYRKLPSPEFLGARIDAIYHIARAHHLLGNLDRARIHYLDALRLAEHSGNRLGIAAAKLGLGRLRIELGQAGAAAADLEQSRQIYLELNDAKRAEDAQRTYEIADRIRKRAAG